MPLKVSDAQSSIVCTFSVGSHSLRPTIDNTPTLGVKVFSKCSSRERGIFVACSAKCMSRSCSGHFFYILCQFDMLIIPKTVCLQCSGEHGYRTAMKRAAPFL
jgi:hypothetical protein